MSHLSNKVLSNKLQKENNPRDEYKNVLIQKAVKISVVNDFVEKTAINNPRLSIQLDVTNNKKTVKIPNSEADLDSTNESNNYTGNEDQKLEEQNKRLFENNNDENSEEKEEEFSKDTELVAVCDHGNKRYYISVDDYKSPLGALGSTT